MKISEIINEGGVTTRTTAGQIEQVKKLYDANLSGKEIGKRIGLPVRAVRHILWKYYRERGSRYDPRSDEQIAEIKKLFDQGMKINDIAGRIHKSVQSIRKILYQYYGDRQLRYMPYSQEELNKIKQMFDDGQPIRSIGDSMGRTEDDIRSALNTYYKNRKLRTSGAKHITSGQVKEMSKLYANGISLSAIGKIHDVTSRTVHIHLKKLPNYQILKQQRASALDAHKDDLARQAATNIYRPGSIGNDRLQGPLGRSNRGRISKP